MKRTVFIKLLALVFAVSVLLVGCVDGTTSSDSSNLDSDIVSSGETVTSSNTKNVSSNENENISSDTKSTPVSSKEQKTAQSDVRVHFIDIGQGDSIFIEFPDRTTMLIDAAKPDHGSEIIGYINKLGYKTVNYLVATHPDSDHIGSMPEVFAGLDIKSVYAPDADGSTKTYYNFLDAVLNEGLSITRAVSGKVIKETDGLSVKILSPAANAKYTDSNDYSVVILITYKHTKMLFTGDAPCDILKAASVGKINLLKVSHHGSNTGLDNTLAKSLSPDVAVISVGENNYGHPTEKVLGYLKNVGASVYRTDVSGTVKAVSDGVKITVSAVGKKNAASSSSSSKKATSSATSSSSAKTVTSSKKQNAAVTVNTTYILNTNTKKIHKDGCSAVKKINAENKSATNKSVSELIKEGYTRCKICNP